MPHRHGPVGVELTAYQEVDGGPAELRVDLVDTNGPSTLASMGLDEAANVAFRIVAELERARARPKSRPEPVEVRGTALRALRRSLGLSLREVARRAGLSHSHLSQVERCRRPVTPAVIDGYGRVFRRPVADLLDQLTRPPPAGAAAPPVEVPDHG